MVDSSASRATSGESGTATLRPCQRIRPNTAWNADSRRRQSRSARVIQDPRAGPVLDYLPDELPFLRLAAFLAQPLHSSAFPTLISVTSICDVHPWQTRLVICRLRESKGEGSLSKGWASSLSSFFGLLRFLIGGLPCPK